MNYYLISPRVDGYSIKGFLDTMFDKHIVMMGWGTDKQLGVAFYNIKKGDFILVAQRVNWKFTYYFAGIVADDTTFNVDGCQCKNLKHFVDLRNSNINYLENASFYEMQVIKALMSINPQNNRAVISNLNEIIQYQKHEEMIEQYLSLLNSNHNLILTGAPGTGKTYMAKEIAKAMGAEGERVGFVQFHPSYDYTDFVEGLRPLQDSNGNLGFERKDGAFKELCKKAISAQVQIQTNFDDCWNKLIKLIQTQGKTRIGKQEYDLSQNLSLRMTNGDTLIKKTIWNTYIGEKGTKSGGLQTYMNDVVTFMKEQFGLNEYKEKFVFIIDEINRGEISKIFGELFFSIGPGYRGAKQRVSTQYQNMIDDDDVFKEGFYVPENVYIIGTMNDIDRSVEIMDFAFRRRFAFKEIKAEENVGMLDELDKITEGWTEKAINRMKHLNAAIEKVEGLSSAYHLGASYFLKLKNYKDAANPFGELWDNHIAGLLFEYLRGVPDAAKTIDDLKRAYDNEFAEDNG